VEKKPFKLFRPPPPPPPYQAVNMCSKTRVDSILVL
jgi:hypothetical protein